MEVLKPEIKGILEKPLIVITPHSSRYIPDDFKERFNLDERELMKFTDSYTDELYSEIVSLGGVLIPGTVSKFVVQLNRKIKMKEKGLSYNEKENGAFIEKSWTGNRVMVPELAEEEKTKIYGMIYLPYLKAIDLKMREAQEKFGMSILIDGHSFSPVTARGSARKEDYLLGTRNKKTAGEELIELMFNALKKENRKVGIDKYGWNGGYTTGHYSRLANPEEMLKKGINPEKSEAVQIETNKRLYLDAETLRKNADFEKIKSEISYCLERIIKSYILKNRD